MFVFFGPVPFVSRPFPVYVRSRPVPSRPCPVLVPSLSRPCPDHVPPMSRPVLSSGRAIVK